MTSQLTPWTGSEAHRASYPNGYRGLLSGVKRPERAANHSPPSTAEVKDAWSYTSPLLYAPTKQSCTQISRGHFHTDN